MQGLLARQGVALGVDQEAKTILQALRQLLRRQHLDPGGGQFNCQRDAIQSLADLQHMRHILRRQVKILAHGARPFDKELNGGVVAHGGNPITGRTTIVGPLRFRAQLTDGHG